MFSEKYAMATCPICSSKTDRWRDKATDWGVFFIDRCRACGYAFVNPRPTVEYLKEFYADSGYRKNAEIDNLSLEFVENKVKKDFPDLALIYTDNIVSCVLGYIDSENREKKTLLDVGCGFGFFVKSAIKHGFVVSALELGKQERRISKQMTGISAMPVCYEEYQQKNGYYSAILMTQILEHARDINFWVTKSYDLLMDGGVIAISVPNFGSLPRILLQGKDPHVIPPAHLNYFNGKNIRMLLEKHGFECLSIRYMTMIPYSNFEDRFNFLGVTGSKVIYRAFNLAMAIMDKLNRGMVLTVYAKKINKH